MYIQKGGPRKETERAFGKKKLERYYIHVTMERSIYRTVTVG
jgi:hypothetical protein